MKLNDFISQCIILIILNMFSPIITYYGLKNVINYLHHDLS